MSLNLKTKEPRMESQAKPDSQPKIIPQGWKISDKICEKHKRPMLRLILPMDKEIFSCRECSAENETKRKEEEGRVIAYQKQSRLNSLLHNAMITPRFKAKTFDNYKPGNEGQTKALETCRWFLGNWQDSVGLIFIGGPGTGKNHLASALVQKFISDNSKTALITETIKIIRAIKDSWRHNDITETQAMRDYVESDLLVIDEVGVQFGSETERMYLTEIVNDRYNHMRPTILIGNVTLDEMKKAIGERAVERFREGGRVVPFTWESYRGRKEVTK